MKVYSVKCFCDEGVWPCGIFSTMNLAISEIIHHNCFRTDVPTILTSDTKAQVIYEGNTDYNSIDYYIEEIELNKWEEN
jgi:hypothetical protein